MEFKAIGDMFVKVLKNARKNQRRRNFHYMWVDSEKNLCYVTDSKIMISARVDAVAEGSTESGFYDLLKNGTGRFIFIKVNVEDPPIPYENAIPQNFKEEDIFHRFECVDLSPKNEFSEMNRVMIQMACLKAQTDKRNYFVNSDHINLIASSGMAFNWTIFKHTPVVLLSDFDCVRIALFPLNATGLEIRDTVQKFFNK